MTEIPPAQGAPPHAEDAAFEVMRVDAVLTGRAMSAAEFLTGVLLNAQLETVGRPDQLPAGLFLDEDGEGGEGVGVVLFGGPFFLRWAVRWPGRGGWWRRRCRIRLTARTRAATDAV